jgi:hypothetical protein
MQIYILSYSPICEDHDIIRAYIDPDVASEQCSLMNEQHKKENPYHWASTVYFVEGPFEVVE